MYLLLAKDAFLLYQLTYNQRMGRLKLSQYLVCPPFALKAASLRLGILVKFEEIDKYVVPNILEY